MGKSAKNQAVVVGVSEYRAPITKLPEVAADVREIAKVLQSKDGAFPELGTVVLTDQRATKGEIEAAILNAFGATAGDTIFVYIAGHGAVENDQYYYIPYDADINDLAASAVSLSWIKDQFDQCRSERIFLWLDCCHSGGILKRRSLTDETSIVKRTLEVIRGQGRVIIAACTAEQAAYESATIGHGVFTHALLRGLKGEAVSHGEVTSTSLFEFIDRQIGTARQRPMMFGQMTGRIVLVHYADRTLGTKDSVGLRPTVIQSSGNWIMLDESFLDATKVRRLADGSLSVDVKSVSAECDATIQSLTPTTQNRHGNRIAFAYGNDGCDVEVKSITSESLDDGQLWTITLKPIELPSQWYLESTIKENGKEYTPRDIAEMRAKVVLLDEKQPVPRGIATSLLHQAAGNNSGSDCLPCVIKDIFKAYNSQPDWKSFARLKAIYLLKTTRTVEHVLDLAIKEISDSKVEISFRGRRARRYANAESETVSVAGSCVLVT